MYVCLSCGVKLQLGAASKARGIFLWGEGFGSSRIRSLSRVDKKSYSR